MNQLLMHELITLDNDESTNGDYACEQICQNIEGSYTCSCYTGYNLTSNFKYCSGKIFLFVLCHRY